VPGGRSAQGDRHLTVALDAIVSEGSRSIAVAAVDVMGTPATRFAFIEADLATRFEIGSITKGLTGMVLADAVERGEVSLDTVVSDLVPACSHTAFGSITVKELCTQTSGLPGLPRGPHTTLRGFQLGVLGWDPYRGITASQLMTKAARQRLTGRGQHQYSNLGSAVLGQVLAIAASTDFPTLLSERLLSPTGMRSTAVASDKEPVPRGWSLSGRSMRPWILDGYAPAGGVVSTIDDMARLCVAILDGSVPGLASMRPIDGVATRRPDRKSGMFWVLGTVPGSELTIVGHSGRTGGYSAFLALLPDIKRGVVVLENVARGPEEQQRMAFSLLTMSVGVRGATSEEERP
jgi:CubicO group peptidase (beta-lactamase class C family)